MVHWFTSAGPGGETAEPAGGVVETEHGAAVAHFAADERHAHTLVSSDGSAVAVHRLRRSTEPATAGRTRSNIV